MPKTHIRDTVLERNIDAYLKGTLSEKEVEELWIQLLKKPAYISLLETEIDLLRTYQPHQEAVDNKSSRWKLATTAAAVIILTIMILAF
jgi:hypothetical protein